MCTLLSDSTGSLWPAPSQLCGVAADRFPVLHRDTPQTHVDRTRGLSCGNARWKPCRPHEQTAPKPCVGNQARRAASMTSADRSGNSGATTIPRSSPVCAYCVLPFLAFRWSFTWAAISLFGLAGAVDASAACMAAAAVG